jgi:hypothetical protein
MSLGVSVFHLCLLWIAAFLLDYSISFPWYLKCVLPIACETTASFCHISVIHSILPKLRMKPQFVKFSGRSCLGDYTDWLWVFIRVNLICLAVKYFVVRFKSCPWLQTLFTSFIWHSPVHASSYDSNKSTNKVQLFFTSLLLDVHTWLNMFRASPRLSSGAYNCTWSLWFYLWKETAGALLVMVWPASVVSFQR